MRQQAELRKERHTEYMRALQRYESAEASTQAAAGRGGRWIRRVLVGSIVFAVIIAPFIIAMYSDTQTVIQYTQKAGGHLWGLLGPERTQTRFLSIEGYLIAPETRHALLAVVAFYFGQGAAK